MGGGGKRFVPSPHSEKTKYIGVRRWGGGGGGANGKQQNIPRVYVYVLYCLVQLNVSFSENVVTKTQMEEYRVWDAHCWVIVDGSHRSELCSCVVKPSV